MPQFSHLRAGTDPSHSLPTFPHCPHEKGEEHRGLIYLRPCSQPGPERAQCKAKDARVRYLSPVGPTRASPVSLSVIPASRMPLFPPFPSALHGWLLLIPQGWPLALYLLREARLGSSDQAAPYSFLSQSLNCGLQSTCHNLQLVLFVCCLACLQSLC